MTTTRTTATLCAALAAMVAHAQLLDKVALDSVRTFHSLERALQDPDQVYRLDLSGRKLREVPEEIKRFRNLNALDLSSNRLKTLPGWLGELPHIQEFRASRNKLAGFPAVVCQWRRLKRLDMSRNSLSGLPACMGQLKELVSLDLWNNDLGEFPDEIAGMEALRFLDLRAIQFEQQEMDRIQGLLPHARIWFSQPCNCGGTP